MAMVGYSKRSFLLLAVSMVTICCSCQCLFAYTTGAQLANRALKRAQCPLRCPEIYKPVCGSNGQTYDNKCFLELESCTGKNIELAHGGRCDSGPKRKHEEVEEKCDLNCSKKKGYVCASNDRTYYNKCLFDEAVCRGRSIELVAKGKCKPQKGKFICTYECENLDDDSVCGTDGESYPNLCVLEQADCYLRDVELASKGDCKRKGRKLAGQKRPGRADRLICASNGRTYKNMASFQEAVDNGKPIEVDYEGKCEPQEGKYICGRRCSKENRPVCGTNMKTYTNECNLEQDDCFDTNVQVASYGECSRRTGKVGGQKKAGSTDDMVCATNGRTYRDLDKLNEAIANGKPIEMAYEGKCKPQEGKYICNNRCTKEYRPVCGTNMKTYTNECTLEQDDCFNSDVQVASYSECSRSSGLRPGQKKAARGDQSICASNGLTYLNKKLFELAVSNGKKINVASEGKCKEPRGKFTCSNICTLELNLVCGTDGKTYGNPCELEQSNCFFTDVQLARMGPCEPPTGTDQPEESRQATGRSRRRRPRKSCNPNCGERSSPICGSNGMSFDNKCQLDFFRCMGIRVEMAHDGECNN